MCVKNIHLFFHVTVINAVKYCAFIESDYFGFNIVEFNTLDIGKKPP